MPTVPVHARLSEEQQAKLDNYMAEHGLKPSEAIRILLELGFATELPDGFWLGFQEGIRQGRRASMSSVMSATREAAHVLRSTISQENES